MRFYFIIFVLTALSCKDTKRNVEITNSVEKDKQYASLKDDSDKDLLKQKLIADYLKVPKYIFGSKNALQYNSSREFVQIDSLLNNYENRDDLTVREAQFLAIYKFKRYLLTSNYNKALEQFNDVSVDNDLENYTILLMGVANFLKDDFATANGYFEQILDQFNVDEVENNGFCDKFFLINALLDKQGIDTCSSYSQSYEDFLAIGKVEIIRECILSDIEL